MATYGEQYGESNSFRPERHARGLTWLEPTLRVELMYSEIMGGCAIGVPRARLNGNQASSVRASSHMT